MLRAHHAPVPVRSSVAGARAPAAARAGRGPPRAVDRDRRRGRGALRRRRDGRAPAVVADDDRRRRTGPGFMTSDEVAKEPGRRG